MYFEVIQLKLSTVIVWAHVHADQDIKSSKGKCIVAHGGRKN